jgi:hypothetical protein
VLASDVARHQYFHRTCSRPPHRISPDGPGFNGPLLLVGQVSGQGDGAAFDRLLAATAHIPEVAGSAPPGQPGSRLDGHQLRLHASY